MLFAMRSHQTSKQEKIHQIEGHISRSLYRYTLKSNSNKYNRCTVRKIVEPLRFFLNGYEPMW